MTRRVLLLEIGAGDLPAATPTPQTASSWFPTPYVTPPPLAPGGFALASIVGGVRASWNAVAGANVTYELQRAPDASGAPGAAQSVYVGTVLVYNSNESTKTWWRVRTVVRGVPSSWTAWTAATPVPAATSADVDAAQEAADDAQAAADAAQGSANTATQVAVQVPIVNPTFDATPAGYGWVADAGSGWVTDMTGITPGGGTGCAKHVGGSGAASGSYRNIGRRSCQPGQIVKYQALIKAIGANGYCTPTISFQNAAGAEITSAAGALVSGTQTYPVSFTAPPAPAGTVAVVFQLTVSGHTAGTYLCDNLATNLQPTSLDEIPDGGSKFASVFTPGQQQGIWAPGQNMIPNPSGALGFTGLPGFAWIGGSQQNMKVVADDTLGNAGPEFVCWFPGTASIDQGFSFIVPCSVGPVTMSADICMQTVASAMPFIELRFLNGSGSEINTSIRPRITAVRGAMARYSVTQALPSGTASINVVVRYTGTMASNSVATWRNLKLEVGSVATPFNDFASQMGNQLTNPGSGQRLGDQRNVPSSLSRAYGAVRSSTALTVYSTGAVDVNAHTLTMGPASINYSAVSNAVTGLTTGQTYQIYTRDNYAGGSPTWLATQSASTANSFDDAYIGGSVTVPSTGSGGGGWGGGGGGCVHVDSWLQSGLRAKHVRRWQRLDCAHRGKRYRRWQSWPARVRFEPCVRIIAEGGAALVCSIHTPFDLPDGSTRFAPAMYGHEVLTEHGWRRVIDVIGVGIQPVMRIHVGGRSYAAGEDPTNRIYSHNPVK